MVHCVHTLTHARRRSEPIVIGKKAELMVCVDTCHQPPGFITPRETLLNSVNNYASFLKHETHHHSVYFVSQEYLK